MPITAIARSPSRRPVTPDGYLRSRLRLPRTPPDPRRRFEYATRTRFHLDMPLMQRNQRRAMADRDDGRIWQNLAQHTVDFRFQLLVKRRCCLIEEQPIRLVENGPRDRQTLRPVVLAVDFRRTAMPDG
jgi:hypothetical protein